MKLEAIASWYRDRETYQQIHVHNVIDYLSYEDLLLNLHAYVQDSVKHGTMLPHISCLMLNKSNYCKR